MSAAATDPRDLSFAPIVNPAPQRLTTAQLAEYNERGFLRPFTLFTGADAERNRAYFDFLIGELQRQNPGLDTYAINGFHTTCAGLYDLVTHPVLLDHVQDLVGPDIIAWGTHYFCKQPHDPKLVPWHQDASYWPLSPARTVTVWLAIDDADVGNAAMQFLPGTHRLGHLPWKDTARPAVLNQEIQNIGQYGAPVADELRAGEFSLHADMLAHGSSANPSARRRCGLTIRYCAPLVRPLDPGWGKQAILCRGRDPYGHWQPVPRPSGEDVSLRPWQKPIGGN